MSIPPRPPSPDHRAGFSRSGFAPLPHRHDGLPPPPDRSFEERDFDRRTRPTWAERMDGRDPREDWDRRPPPPRWDNFDDRPKRRRSPSPSFGPSSRARLRSPSPPRFPPAQGHGLPDPADLPHLLQFRQFAEWFRASHPQTARADDEELRRAKEDLDHGQGEIARKEKVGMAKRYERYRKEFSARQLYTLFLTHRDAPWFQEKYSQDPKSIALRRRVNRQGRVPTAERYLDALRTGEYDSITYDMASEPSGKRPTNGRRLSELEESDGLDRALGETSMDDPLRVEVPPAERQIFVKTVPPSTSRKDLENLFSQQEGFQYLALTEPAVKKALHRVGWAQFAEGVSVEEVVEKVNNQKIDNFTFHMGINGSAVIGRIRTTPEVASSLERLQTDAEKAKALTLHLEEDLMGDDEDDTTEEKPEVGSNGHDAQNGKEKAVPGLRERGSTIVQDKIDRLLEERSLIGELKEEQSLEKAKLVLDHWMSYLRNGLSTCYYCVAAMSFPEELHRKCISHMRSHSSAKGDLDTVPEDDLKEEKLRGDDEGEDRREDPEDRSKSTRKDRDRSGFPVKTGDEKWEENLDTKLAPLLGSIDVIEYGGRDPYEETKKLTAPMIKQEEESKYRCKECSKLFRAPEFVIKHVATKHPNGVKSKLDELAVLNAFAVDPQHLQPTLAIPAAVNDQIPNPLGNLSVMPSFNPSFAGAGAGNNGFPTDTNNPAINPMMQQQMLMMMQMQQAMMMNMGGHHGSNGGNASSTSTRGGSLADRMGGFADDAPAPQPGGAVDPRASRGRVSYQDLDEPGGGGDGGLPY